MVFYLCLALPDSPPKKVIIIEDLQPPAMASDIQMPSTSNTAPSNGREACSAVPPSTGLPSSNLQLPLLLSETDSSGQTEPPLAMPSTSEVLKRH